MRTTTLQRLLEKALAIAACALLSVGIALAVPCPQPPDCTQPIVGEELISNGDFNCDGTLTSWNVWPFSNPPNPQIFNVADQSPNDPAATITVSPSSTCDGGHYSYCIRISQEDGLLRGLRPDTNYTLRFYAKADNVSPTVTPTIHPEIYMRPHSNPQQGQYYYVWQGAATLDQTFREYVFEFRTPTTLPQDFCNDSLNRLIRLDLGVGTADARVWIDKVSLKTSGTITLGQDDLLLADFEANENWQGSVTQGASFARDTQNATHGVSSMRLTVPANAGAFVARSVPINLTTGLWDMTLSVCADDPERIGRMYVIARTGAGDHYSWRSFGGLLDPCSTIVLRKEEFFHPIGTVGVDWGNISTIGIKVDSNSIGPVNVWIDDLVVHPKTTIDGSDVDQYRPPLMTNLRARTPASDRITVAWTTDEPADIVLQCGLTPGTGATAFNLVASTDHEISVSGLQPGKTYHCRATSIDQDWNFNESSSGDFTVDTEPVTPWVPPDPSSFYPIALAVVTRPFDVEMAADAGFNTVHNYMCAGEFLNESNACFLGQTFEQATGQYLNEASSLGLKAVIQPLASNFVADWSNCNCSDGPGLTPVCHNREWGDPPCPTRNGDDPTCPAHPNVSDGCGNPYCSSAQPSLCCLMTNVDQRIDWFSNPANTGRDALLAYYLADEPECALNVNPDRLYAIYQRIKYADYVNNGAYVHPVITGTTAIKNNAYFDTWDIGLQDKYPIPGPISSIVPTLADAASTSKPFHWIFQAYSPETDHNWPMDRATRYPSHDEMRTMAYLGIIHGAQGAWAFSQAEITTNPGTEWVYAGLSRVARELRRLEPVLASPLPGLCAAADTGSTIKFLRKSYAGKQYLIASEADGVSQTTGFRLGAGATGVVNVLGESRATPITINGGRFSDTWQPYETHVYQVTIDSSVGPADPGQASGSIQGNNVLVSWADNSCDETGFRVERKGGPDPAFVPVGMTGQGITSFVDHPPRDLTSYTYRAVSLAGATASYGPESAPVAVPFRGPTMLTATPGSGLIVNLSWVDDSTSETGYRVERRLYAGGTYSLLTSTPPNPVAPVQGQNDAKMYAYRVYAYKTGLPNSGYSNEVVSPALAPLTSSAIPANNSVNIARVNLQLKWKVLRATTHDVWLGTNPDPSTWTRRCTGIASSPCVIPSLPGSTTHYWRVDSYNAAGAVVTGPAWTFTTRP